MKVKWLFIFLCLEVFCNCATTQGNRKRRAICNWWPSNNQWQDVVVNAVSHPGSWVPMIGAVVVFVGGWDQDISDWAIKTRPLFGSHKAAQNASDMLCTSGQIGMIITSLGIPSDDDPWLLSTTRRIALKHLGVITAVSTTSLIKGLTERDRPNGNKWSFPSGHATRTASYVGMGYRNLDLIGMRSVYNYSAQLILTSLVAGTGWARIEASKHYPTDVLVGAALGNFIALLVHDAFLKPIEYNKVYFQIDRNGTFMLVITAKF